MDTNLTPTIEKTKFTIKTNQIVETEVEVELDLPYYFRKKYGGFAKVDNEQRVISVMCLSEYWMVSVSILDGGDRSEIAKGTPCTEEEFNTAFQTALSKIQNL